MRALHLVLFCSALCLVRASIPQEQGGSQNTLVAKSKAPQGYRPPTTLEEFGKQYDELNDGNKGDYMNKFFAYADIGFVKIVTREYQKPPQNNQRIFGPGFVADATVFSVGEGLYDRAVDLLKLMYGNMGNSGSAILEPDYEPSKKLLSKDEGAPLKRLLEFGGDALKKQPEVFSRFCQELLKRIMFDLSNSASKLKEWLRYLAGLPGLLTAKEFVEGIFQEFSVKDDAPILFDVIWREAVLIALKDERYGEELREFVYQEYELNTSISKQREEFLQKFKTKEELEEEWTRENLGMKGLVEGLGLATEHYLPLELQKMILEYGIPVGTEGSVQSMKDASK